MKVGRLRCKSTSVIEEGRKGFVRLERYNSAGEIRSHNITGALQLEFNGSSGQVVMFDLG